MSRFTQTFAVLMACYFICGAVADPVKVDPRLPKYEPPKEKIKESVASGNSDVLNNILTLWAEQMLILHPDMEFEIEGKGSSSPEHALTFGRSNLAGLTRLMKDDAAKRFRDKWGYDATPLRVAIGVIAVFVHKDNPIAKKGLTLQQVDAIFGKDRKGGAPADIKTWGDLGLDGEWKEKPIVLHGRNSRSFTYGYIKQIALFKGEFKDEVIEQPGSSVVVAAVGKDRYAIGYSSIGYATSEVAVVPIAPDAKSDYLEPAARHVGKYPLSHYLYLYVNHKPGTSLPPGLREFLRYVYSAQGQDIVIKDAWLPIDAAFAKEEAAKVGIELKLVESK